MARPSTTRTVLSARLTPDELKQLAETHMAQANRTAFAPERIRILAIAETLIDLAETKKLLHRYERRLLN